MKRLILPAIVACFWTVGNSQIPKTDIDYYLSVVTATIKTGKDNKEYPSWIDIDVYCGNKTRRTNWGFSLSNYKNELPKYSTMPLVISQRPGYDASENSLYAYKQNGLKFVLRYNPNIALDAWKIESISLTLEFKDKAGNPHPSMGRKTITFNDSNLWMDNFDKVYTFYKTDKYFNPLPVQQCNLGGNISHE